MVLLLGDHPVPRLSRASWTRETPLEGAASGPVGRADDPEDKTLHRPFSRSTKPSLRRSRSFCMTSNSASLTDRAQRLVRISAGLSGARDRPRTSRSALSISEAVCSPMSALTRRATRNNGNVRRQQCPWASRSRLGASPATKASRPPDHRRVHGTSQPRATGCRGQHPGDRVLRSVEICLAHCPCPARDFQSSPCHLGVAGPIPYCGPMASQDQTTIGQRDAL